MDNTDFIFPIEEREYNQRPDETYEDWKYRLLIEKANNKTDLTWAQVAELLGNNFGESYYRRMGNAIAEYRKYLNSKDSIDYDLNEENEEDNNFIAKYNALDKKQIELQKEKVKTQDQKRELNKQIREWARAEHIQSEIIKAINNLAHTKPLSISPHEVYVGDCEAALLLSDWHYGQFSANEFNTYNEVEFKNRLESVLNNTLKYCNDHDVDNIHIFCLGDLINGLIHVTTRINNIENVTKQTMTVAEYLAEMLAAFANNLNQVNIYFARGNHERITPNIKESLTNESFLDIIPWYLKARLNNISNINIVNNKYDSEIIITDILNSKIFAVHGHRDKITNAVQNLSLMYKVFPDYIFMGHFHHNEEREIHTAEVIVNGSLCGTDDYSINIRKTSKPSQKLLIFDMNGKKCTYNII